MRISDWSSDVCSSDLFPKALTRAATPRRRQMIGHSLAQADKLVIVETKGHRAVHHGHIRHGRQRGEHAVAPRGRCQPLDLGPLRQQAAAKFGVGLDKQDLLAGIRRRHGSGKTRRARSDDQNVGVSETMVITVGIDAFGRSEEHTSELQSLMRISYAVFCLKKKHRKPDPTLTPTTNLLRATLVIAKILTTNINIHPPTKRRTTLQLHYT